MKILLFASAMLAAASDALSLKASLGPAAASSGDTFVDTEVEEAALLTFAQTSQMPG